MDVDLEEEIEAAIAKERAKWEKILENAQKVSEDYGQQVENLTSQLQDLRRQFLELESRRPSLSNEESDKIRELEEALTRTRLECLEREKAAARRAREEGELALRREREVRSAQRSTCVPRRRALPPNAAAQKLSALRCSRAPSASAAPSPGPARGGLDGRWLRLQ
jgi:hypothetical protein